MPDTPNVLEALQSLQTQFAAQQAAMTLRESLEDSGLPVDEKRKIRQKFAGKPLDEEALDTAIEEAQQRLQEAQESAKDSTTEGTELTAPRVEIKAKQGRWLVLCEGEIIANCDSRLKAEEARVQYVDARQLKINESLRRIEEQYETRARKAECKVMLKERLGESGLPQTVIEKVEKAFKDRVFDEQELTDSINDHWDIISPFVGKGEVFLPGQERPYRVRLGESEYDKLCLAFDGFWAGENLKGQDGKAITRFRHLSEAYQAFTGKRWDPQIAFQESGRLIEGSRYDSHLRYGAQADRVVESSGRFNEALQTTSWAQIMGDSITRRMLAEYAMPMLQTWRLIASEISSITDFRTQRRMRFGGYGLLPVVAEAASYTPLPSPTDQEATYAISKRGGTEQITLEMMANDDVQSLRRIPQRLGRAAGQTLYRAVFDLFDTNAALTYDDDTTALFTAGHGNLLSSVVLGADGLDQGINAMKRQAAYGNTTEVLGLNPGYLIHPTGLRRAAVQQIETSPNEGGTADFAANAFREFNMQRIQVDYFASQSNWYLAARGADAPTIEVGFFRGQEDPEIFLADAENVEGGSQWSADKMAYKIRHIWGLTVLDHRAFIGSRF